MCNLRDSVIAYDSNQTQEVMGPFLLESYDAKLQSSYTLD
jgi:hypothetical protein